MLLAEQQIIYHLLSHMKKTSAIATDQPLTEIEIRALSLVGDSNRVTTGVGADPPTHDDSEDSDQTSTERPDDRPTASTSGVTQPSPDFIPARGDEEEEEEQLILEPAEVEMGVKMEEGITVPCGPAGTSSTTDSIFRGFPHVPSDPAGPSGAQQRIPSIAAPFLQRQRLAQKRSVAARQIGTYQDMVRLSHRLRAAQGHGYDSRKHRGAIRTTVGGYVASDHCNGANRQLCRCHAAIDGIGTWRGIPLCHRSRVDSS